MEYQINSRLAKSMVRRRRGRTIRRYMRFSVFSGPDSLGSAASCQLSCRPHTNRSDAFLHELSRAEDDALLALLRHPRWPASSQHWNMPPRAVRSMMTPSTTTYTRALLKSRSTSLVAMAIPAIPSTPPSSSQRRSPRRCAKSWLINHFNKNLQRI
jgi:hypothetical protein